MPVSERTGSVVTIGAYDGVHFGHRRVISEVCRLAVSEGLSSVVVTFDRHPASVVRPESAPLLLTDLDQKLELLRATGIDDVRVIEFTTERSTESAEDFVEEVLVGELSARVVVVGRDFHFGKARGGNVKLLETMGVDCGFRVVPFELVGDGSEAVSSTRIRGLIGGGELAAAAHLLGRPHEVRGTIVSEAAGLPGDAGGGATGDRSRDVRFDSTVHVPAGILLPPPGTYDGETGPVGGTDDLLEPCRIVVTNDTLSLRGLASLGAEDSPVRVLFSAGP